MQAWLDYRLCLFLFLDFFAFTAVAGTARSCPAASCLTDDLSFSVLFFFDPLGLSKPFPTDTVDGAFSASSHSSFFGETISGSSFFISVRLASPPPSLLHRPFFGESSPLAFGRRVLYSAGKMGAAKVGNHVGSKETHHNSRTPASKNNPLTYTVHHQLCPHNSLAH